jgi:thymidylate synthase (FAD)
MGTDERIVEAARVSYGSPSKGAEQDKKLLRYLFRNKHTSPFEMVKITFNVKMPIFVMRQWVRHRMQNLNEVSARYTELPKEFYVPARWRVPDKANKQGSTEYDDDLWHESCDGTARAVYQHAWAAYRTLLCKGVARELARIVLPVGIYTECYSTWDLNNLLKFFSLRDDSHAQAEIQDYARAMKEITQACFPWTMEVYNEARN